MIAFVPLTVHQTWFRKSLSDKLTRTHADTDFENYQHRVIINDYISFYNIVLLYHIKQKENSNAWLVYNNIIIKPFSLFVYEIVIHDVNIHHERWIMNVLYIASIRSIYDKSASKHVWYNEICDKYFSLTRIWNHNHIICI